MCLLSVTNVQYNLRDKIPLHVCTGFTGISQILENYTEQPRIINIMYESTNENDQYVPRNISIDIPNNPETVLH